MKAIVYGRKNCVWCDRAKELLVRNLIHYDYVDIEEHSMTLELFKQNGWKTVPQIFIDDNHIGGFEDLKKLF